MNEKNTNRSEKETYQEYVDRKQEEFNALPIFWAFSQSQFDEAMKKAGLDPADTDKIYAFGGGGYYKRSDAPKIRDYFRKKNELPELMKDYDFAYDAFRYELGNHEYIYNWEGDYDVCSCFGECEYDDNKTWFDYLKEMGYDETVRKAFYNAMIDYEKRAEA